MAEDTARSPAQLLARARVLAAEVFGPAAMSVETSQQVPPEHLDPLPLAEWQQQDRAGLRMNGSLALGLAARCGQLIGPSPLDAQLAACRAGLDTADPDGMPAARAAACELAMRATADLVVAQGARAILADQDAQRLAREALFLLVFGSRPTIRQALAGLLADRSVEGAAWRNR